MGGGGILMKDMGKGRGKDVGLGMGSCAAGARRRQNFTTGTTCAGGTRMSAGAEATGAIDTGDTDELRLALDELDCPR